MIGTGYAAAYGIITGKARAGQAMACFSEDELPVLNALASEFVLCDHWFSSMAGPTEPNRMFVHAATSGVWDDSPTGWQQTKDELGGDGVSFPQWHDLRPLRKAKIPFRIYAGDVFPNVGLLHGISINDDIDDFANFEGDISNADFDAAYTFIEPNYDALVNNFKDGNSQHPLGSVHAGEQLIKQVYEIIRQSPRWNDSMLVVTWDEHGGFYDHVLPPRATPTGERGQSHGYMFDQLGPRVPAVVISPWCPKNGSSAGRSSIPWCRRPSSNCSASRPLTVRDRGLVGLQALATLPSPPQDAPMTLPAPPSAGCEDRGGGGRPRFVNAARHRQKRLGTLASSHRREASSGSCAGRKRNHISAGERDQDARRSQTIHGQGRRHRDREESRIAQTAGRRRQARLAQPARVPAS